MSRNRLWVLCPSFRDVPSFRVLRGNIQQTVKETPELADLDLRFVVVDDTGGCDDEMPVLREFPDVRIVTPPFNLGHQRAIVYGLRMVVSDVADSDLLVTLDSDGEDRPEDLPALLGPLLEDSARWTSLCVARRTERSESLQFKVLYLLFKSMFRTLTGTTVRSGNFAAYRGWLARRMLTHPYFDLCYSSTLISLGFDVVSVPCPRGERYEGRSRMSPLSLFMHGIRMLMPYTDRIAVRALTAFSVLFGVGVVCAGAVVGIRLFTSAAIPGWTTFTLLGMLILSVVALGNFVVLFAVFSHSRGISLANLEEWKESPHR
jgi:polyisoprenyl-phosphate glycosyltransferase